jgi:hypothetical protein
MSPRAAIDVTLSWIALGYGVYAAAIEPVRQHDDVQIAIGIEATVLAVLGLLWGGYRRNLGLALIVLGLVAPAIGYATAPLYWDDVELFSDAFWTTLGVGGAVGLPLVAIGSYTLLVARRATRRPDPWWFLPLRWVLQGALFVIVLAFRAGDWNDGIPLVYAGGGLALIALLIALPRRIAVTQRGIGLLLLVLGLGAVAVVVVAGAFVGGHMSEEEAAIGLLPAGLVAFVGLLLFLSGRSGRRRAAALAMAEPPVSTDGLDGAVIDSLPRPDLR